MSLPNADRVVIDPAKIREYLLSETHPVLLRDDILVPARAGSASPGKPNEFGRTLEVDGILTGPSGRSAAAKTIWMIRANEETPRFITAFPR